MAEVSIDSSFSNSGSTLLSNSTPYISSSSLIPVCLYSACQPDTSPKSLNEGGIPKMRDSLYSKSCEEILPRKEFSNGTGRHRSSSFLSKAELTPPQLPIG